MTTTNPNVCNVGAMPGRDPVKVAILHALRAWIHQRPGLDYRNYGDPASYRAELRGITKDLRHARELLRAVEHSDITGAALLEEFPRAYSGRLSCTIEPDGRARLDYCIGQYWPTEYREAAAAVAASALWEYARQNMPAPANYRATSYGHWNGGKFVHVYLTSHATREAAAADVAAQQDPAAWYVEERYAMPGRSGARGSAGDWLRAYFLREFGRGIARRWFS